MAALPKLKHPLVTQPTLWVVDVPLHVQWSHLVQLLRPCGDIRSGGRSTTPDGRQRWAITFCDVYYAEMALATLNGTFVSHTYPSWTLTLSHSSSLDSALPEDPLCAQFVKTSEKDHVLLRASPQQIFRWFRPAGPLVSVRTHVDVGYPDRTCVVQYWDQEAAISAQQKGRFMHSALRNLNAPDFVLRTFSQWTVLGTNMGSNFYQHDIPRVFGKCGTIIHSKVMKTGTLNCQCYVSFKHSEEATAAILLLNETQLNGRKIHIRNYEVAQHDFHLRQAGGNALAPHQMDVPFEPQPQTNPARADQEESNPAPQTKTNKPPSKGYKPDTASDFLAEQRRKKVVAEYDEKLACATRKREETSAIANAARLARIDAETIERAAQASLAQTLAERDATAQSLTDASTAVVAAEAALKDAKERQAQMLERFAAVAEEAAAADEHQRTATWRRIGAEQHEAGVVASHRQAEREEKEVLESAPPEVVEARRLEEVEQSIRKMRELREVEEADKREKEREEQRVREEAARREREEKQEAERRKKEAERLAREERERKAREEAERKAREERERREAAARRISAYKLAAAKEIQRCRQRNVKLKTLGSRWTDARSVQWFKDVSAEFDGTRFCDSQPLTFESVPWPLLHPPHEATLEDIEWGAVEAFFAAAKLLVAQAEYKAFVEKAHRRFHPDKWRARGLMNTILDEDLRQQLESAGNIVAQAITPIWLRTKSE